MLRSFIKSAIRKTLPCKAGRKLIVFCKPTYNWLSNSIHRTYYLIIQRRYNYIAKKLQKKETLKVVFLLIHEASWKYQGIYNLMESDRRFDPVIIVCPYMVYSEDIMLSYMDQTYHSFFKKGYRVVNTYNKSTKKWLDVKKEIKPDIVFFANPYSKLTKDEYFITNYLHCLTFYVPYGFALEERNEMNYNLLIHNIVYRFYVESEFHVSQAKKYSFIKGINTQTLGYPGIDALLFPEKRKISNTIWKINDKKIKRIIWAPHHSIEEEPNVFNYSNFLQFSQCMFDIAAHFKDKIQIAFKPHPILKAKLYERSDWGKEKTDDYYEKWNCLSNTQLNELDYIDLFLTSDAIIMDCGSFKIDYLCLNKPSLYQIRNKNIRQGLNEFGKMGLDCHYLAYDCKDIFNFIEKILIGDNDYLKIKRENFINNHLLPPFGKSAAENIFTDICNLVKPSDVSIYEPVQKNINAWI